jgi:hypothetical protein
MKIHQVEVGLFYASTRTDRHDDANNRFSQFCEPASYRQCVPIILFTLVHFSSGS